MIQSIHTWFLSIDWINKDLWGMFGQWAGAIATFIAVLVAMRQVRISQYQTKFSQQQVELSQKQTETALQQTQLAIQQMEEAKQRETDARKPELEIKVLCMKQEGTHILSILLTNIKQVPTRIYRYDLFHYGIDKDNNIMKNTSHLIKSDNIKDKIPEMIAFGEVYIKEMTVNLLIEEIKKENISRGFFECQFLLITGEIHTLSLFLEHKSVEELLGLNYWHLYVCPTKISRLDEIITKDNSICIISSDSFSYKPTKDSA
jgi:hypothetical protein